jgi:nitrite reductase/ring-hydroxylating ferredoxin subunit
MSVRSRVFLLISAVFCLIRNFINSRDAEHESVMTLSFVKVAETSEVPVGKMKMVKLGDKEVLIANVNGHYYAIANRCTHRGGDLSKGSLDSNIVTCPLHGSRFDVTTGKAISGPKIALFRAKTNDEPSFEVKIEGNDIMLKTG